MSGLSDSFARPINYLRISVTDRCNLRCVYCMPPEGVPLLCHQDVLRYEEILRVVQAAAPLGISKVRLTGGEPLVRAGLAELVRMLARVEGVDDLSLTTNGVLLARHATDLKAAGLKRVNVSLDTLRAERFRHVTRRGSQHAVLEGIEAARRAGLEPVKVNVVLMRGVNEDEVVDFARLTRDAGWNVRFIELMPFTETGREDDRFFPAAEARKRIETLGPLDPCAGEGGGPARYFRLPSAAGTVGFISPVSEHFCFGCNRLRLTAEGKLRLCLLRDEEIDLRAALRNGASAAELESLIARAVASKPKGHGLGENPPPNKRFMVQIGG